MKFTYPSELPVSAARDDIAKAVSSSQVVIVSGQTGSGKTTQLPKILLELGRGTHGRQIVHTQPRRLAARTVAERIASEMGVHLGDEIGYQVRFTDETSPKTRLRVVTDGILLAQIQRDPQLRQYDTIVIDEAHERSLNIDFLLGYLTALLPKRRDLKLIITSATIDSVKFQEHFEHALHEKVPVIEVSGRTYPVQVVYEPLGTAPALMRHVPGFETGAMPGEESYAELSAAPSDGGRDRGSSREPDMDMPTAVARACAELIIHSSHERGARDILVFASGERDIHEFENALRRHYGPRADDMRHPDAIEIMPLFARLSSKEQHRVFEPHTHQRIVIATNVAETSLTVPGIRYVVDPGTARISRYSKTAKVQRLPIEPISQASADQRSGRCGRIADGIAIRLYSREDYENRPRFTEPEILRTSLGAVVLHMLSVGVARTAEDVTNFGFIDPPDMKAVSDGFNELTELKAIGRKRGEVTLTHVGRQLARIPIDVRLGRMVIEAAKSSTPDTLAAVLVIVAFLSLQDPRERPDEARDEADRIHNRYADPSSDYLTALNIWDRIFQADGEPSNNALRRICKSEYFSWLRVRQWKDLVNQLTEMCRELKFKVGSPQPASRPDLAVRQLPINQQAAHSLCCSWDDRGIHTSMLSGLLSMMGMQIVREPKASDFAGLKGAAKAKAIKRAQKMAKNDYQGARGTHFALFPASAVAKSTPQWVMSTELVETSRLWARYSAAIDPAWAEPLAGQLTRTTYAEPHWSGSRGSAVATAKVLLYGLPIISDRTVQWGRINPMEARDFLIRQGLVEGDVQQRFSYDDFLARNRDILDEAAEDASRTRQVSQSVSDEDLYDFYQSVIPNDVTCVADLAKWWKREHGEHPHLLDFDPDKVERLSSAESVSLADYPDHWHALGTDGQPIDLRLSYIYDPHDPADGVTVHVPLKALSRLTPEQFTWNVPGLLDELIVGLIKSLPKSLRVQFVPAPDTARKIRAWIDDRYPALPGTGTSDGQGHAWPDLPHVFTQAAIDTVGAQIHPEVLTGELWEKLPAYLRMTFSIEQQLPAPRNARGRRHARGPVKVLGSGKSLTALQRQFAEQAEASARRMVEHKAEQAASQGKLVEQANLLHKAGATSESRAVMLWRGALDALRMPSERISSRWLGAEALMLASAPYPSTKALVEDLQLATVKRLLPNIDTLPDDDALADAVMGVTEVYEDTVYALAHDVIAILRAYANVDKATSGKADLPMLSVLQSVREHIATLVFPGFIGAMPPAALPRIPKYLEADLIRLTKAKNDKNRDVRWAWEADEARQLVDKAVQRAKTEPAGPRHEALTKQADDARWMLEEFYVSLWAQELGTAKPVSLQRIKKTLGK
ncbi:ATP-dependent RNA helicase HrpA [Bifidobacterium bifidum]|uniref:ATP-dependent helicase HrpA n=2 Tax=Bifidobacterium bifidum TaxID=1681 RepID=A0ABN5UXA9_BIFBI|nr:ATP-dependent RNA helicase HrpA [Bifidobacterium bifidum]ERI84032.1 ATP-dependent helicase HrpA [Bifidobacterium bifidum ATCC 29521 = JCM 1255 = DSM 20456]KFI42608.1 HrpA ATP-dependent helicase [Bifidobacterium bifidum]MBA4556455.1 ATP-dependent RNA helicase HrpA [Bifidobacterium bifidum]MBI6590567.1 ATP-dependent RNA helicase HrpA [Bifidobacterium bifidum]MBP0626423.1 ATP-dependent RNA helicase HrpA [Bifidobacterium bifidum]